MKRAPIIAIACLLATSSSSCRRRRHVYPRSRPSNAAVAGKYAVVGDSEVIKQHGATGTLDLCPDGTFVMRNMPGWRTRRGSLGRDKTWSGHGRWSVRHKEAAPPHFLPPCVLFLEFDGIAGKDANHGTSLPYLVGKAEPYDIHICIGDPDGGRAVILRKTGEPVLPTSGHLEKKGQAND